MNSVQIDPGAGVRRETTDTANPPRATQAADAAEPRAAAPDPAAAKGRIEAIDLARGVAVTLMILSHGVNGLLSFDQFTDWGLVPVHAVTKFSSSLFILVFGIAMAVAFVPYTQAPDWPRRRLKLLLSGVVVFFWYKVLTVVEMMHLYEPADIVDALLYRRFPSYVEILGFYAIALMWVPFFLPLWCRMPLNLRIASPMLMAVCGYYLYTYFDFWGIEPLQAVFVEHDDHYTWGQLSRGPLVLLGLLIGGLIYRYYRRRGPRLCLAAALLCAAAALLGSFALLAAPHIPAQLLAIAHNAGKHPPELPFMLFSVGGALLVLGLVLLGGERLAAALRPITVIGSAALKAFVFHIVVIFVLFRYLLGLWHNVSYLQALFLTLALILTTALWIKITVWIQTRS